ncbi:SUKH-3 domain-containing protein [Streptomyces mirabilis]|uniref:SUKH-3 domain-containing protein n=1 Tax=Streptomyces mirabilis TaxID=68239 RepID=UPI0037DA2FA1
MIRFDSLDPDLLQALRDASWHSQRRVDASPWLDSLQQEGYQPNSKAEEILVALGGLVIEPVNKSGPNFSNDEPFNFDPISAGLASGPWHWRLRKLWGGDISLSANGSAIRASSWRPVGGSLPLALDGSGEWVPPSKTPWSWRFVQIDPSYACTPTRD